MNRKILIAAAYCSFISCLIALYIHGCYTDENNLGGNDIFSSLLVFLIIISLAISIIASTKLLRDHTFISGICIIIAILIIIASSFMIGRFQGYSKASNPYANDYIDSEWIRGITLEEVKTSISSEEENILYFGRNDCNDCVEFEKQFETILEEYQVENNGYYTNLDRDGDNAAELYKLLADYDITEVPALIVVKDNQLIQKLDVKDMKQIESYYSTNF